MLKSVLKSIAPLLPVALVLAAILSTMVPAQAAPPKGESWKLVWNDEFKGSQIDETKWERLGDFKRQQGFWVKEDSYLDGQGHLVLRVKKDSADRYTAGGVRTRDKYEHGFGYFEAKVKFPTQPGHWCAFWIMGHHVSPGPNEGRDGTEIDIMEKAWLTDHVQHALHWGGYGKDHKTTGHPVRNMGMNDGAWHVFGVNWTPTNYVFYVDGKESWRTNAGGVSQVPEYIKLTEEIGHFGKGADVWGTGPISEATLPDQYLIDYVRVYESKVSRWRFWPWPRRRG
jgi:beta-glucanase (GH16 family)